MDMIEVLKQEIKELKAQRKEETRALKLSRKWISVKKSSPVQDIRVIVWSKGQMKLGWFSDGAWYEYDGTWLLKEQDKLSDITHWMATDWMDSTYFPMYGPGLLNRLCYYWMRFTQGASNIAYDLRPRGWERKAQLDKKVVYFQNEHTGEIRMGLPENFPVTPGFHKVVCNTAHEAEAWSDRLRQYNLGRHEKEIEQREIIEGAAAKEIRSNIHHLMANSHSKYGRMFMERYLDRMDKAQDRMRMDREEYLHSEAYEERR